MKNKVLIVFAAAIFFLSASAAAAAPAWVTVHDTGLIWGEDILLGSIADISCADDTRLQELINMRLGTILKPGGTKNVSAYVLNLKIQSSGIDTSNITWSIPDSVTVTRASQTVGTAQIMNVAETKMQQAVRESGEQREWTLESLTTAPDTVIPPGTLTMEAEIPYGIKYTVPTVIYVNFKVKGQPAGRAVCRLQLHIFDNVVVAARAVRANAVMTAEDLRIEKKEISAVNTYYITDLDSVIGKISRYPLKPGDIIRDSLLTSPILIKRGAPVHIVAQNNGLKVQTDGTAMTSGSKDQVIKVKNTVTGVIVSGKVIDEGTVDVSAVN